MSDNLVGEFLSLDTAKRLHKEKENKRDKNILEANIKLVDENRWLKEDNERLKKVIKELEEYFEEKNNKIGKYSIYKDFEIKLKELKERYDL